MRLRSLILVLILITGLCTGCAGSSAPAQIAATTLPVYQFSAILCSGTGLRVTRLVTESVSCLHDYTLQVSQMQAIESAQVVVLSGAGLEEFLDDALSGAQCVIDASVGIPLLCGETNEAHDHEAEPEDAHGHHHENDPHIWLAPENAKIMAQNICDGLSREFPAHQAVFQENLRSLTAQLDSLQAYGEATLSDLSYRELITFHDGFSYFAQAFDLTILEAIEEESGSEASAQELIRLIELVETHQLPGIFTEANGSTAAAQVISAETGANVYTLDMAMSGEDYFEAVYQNINTVKEALG